MVFGKRPQLMFHHSQASTSSILIVIVFFAVVALLVIFGVFIRYSWDPLVAFVKRRRDRGSQHHSRAFFHTQLGAYIAAMMLCNAFSSISFVINAEWVTEGVVTEGALCNTQGIIAQIGDTGGAYFTGTIAIHTFNTLVLRNKLRGWVCLATVVVGWLVAILTAAAPTWIPARGMGPVYGFNGVSCGISTRWPIVNTILRVLPLLLGSIVSVVFYTLIFLVLRGTLVIKNGIRLNFDRTHRWSMSSVTTVEYQRYIAAVARSMLWYPFAYNILLLPEIIESLSQSSGIVVPFQASVFSATIASLLGIANAFILINTLRILRPFLQGNLTVGTTSSKLKRDADMESFYAGAKSPISAPSPSTPETAFADKGDSDNRRVWASPPQSVSKSTTVGQTVARGINGVTRAVSLKRKDSRSRSPNTFEEIARSITPVADLNAMITVPEPIRKKPTLPSSPRLTGASPGLPAPRRDTRSPLIRQPTFPTTPSPAAFPFMSIDLNTPEPSKKWDSVVNAPQPASSRRASANDSLLSMYISRTPEQEDMDKPPMPPPKAAPTKPRPQHIPLSPRPPTTQTSLAPSPLPTLRSARVPVFGYAPDQSALGSKEWLERVGRVAPTAPTKAERRRSRSLDLDTVTPTLQPRMPALSARTVMYGDLLTATTPRRDPSLIAVSGRRPSPMTPNRSGSTTLGAYGYL